MYPIPTFHEYRTQGFKGKFGVGIIFCPPHGIVSWELAMILAEGLSYCIFENFCVWVSFSLEYNLDITDNNAANNTHHPKSTFRTLK